MIFWNFFNKHKQRGGDPLDIFYGPSLQIELDAPLWMIGGDFFRRLQYVEQWAAEYNRGTALEMYSRPFSAAFHGQDFAQACEYVFQRLDYSSHRVSLLVWIWFW